MANTKITTNVIADDAITSAKIADDAVGNDQLASGLTLGGNTTATLATAAQTNITRLGTLTTLTVDDITIDGSTISDGADLTVDVGGDIVLDAAGQQIIFASAGTNVGQIDMAGTDLEIKSLVNNADLFIRGTDGGSEITALTFDMSEAGAATFNDLVDAKNFKINGGQGSDGQVLTSTGSGVAWEDASGGVAGISSSADATAITINSSEQVGIGQTSPSNKLQVDVNSASAGTDAISIQNSGVTTTSHTTGLRFQFGTAVPSAIRSLLTNTSNGEGTLSFFTSSDGTAGNLSEAMRIDSAGKIGIGTTDTSNAKLVFNGAISSGSDTAMIDFDGYGTRGEGSSQSINFRMGRTGQATDQPAQIKSFFMGGGATAGQTSIGFKFVTISANTQQDQFLIDAAYSRFKFNTSESPQSNNPQTNNCIVIGPSSSGAVTQSLTNACVLQNRSGELYAVDSSHNNTQLTPHNWGLISSGPSEELAWTYYSQRPNPSNNEQLQTINVDMAKVIRKVEDLVGEKLIYTENSEKDGHTFKTIISDIQTTLADLKTRVETLEG